LKQEIKLLKEMLHGMELSKSPINIAIDNMNNQPTVTDNPASTDVLRTLYNGCGLVRLDQTFTQRCLNVIGTFFFLRNSPTLAERCRNVISARYIEIELQMVRDIL
jgi:hypothetical protein